MNEEAKNKDVFVTKNDAKNLFCYGRKLKISRSIDYYGNFQKSGLLGQNLWSFIFSRLDAIHKLVNRKIFLYENWSKVVHGDDNR